jgi:hypothetical protein
VRVAVIQDAPVLFEVEPTLEKVAELSDRAAADGAQLAVFPEAFIGGYPKGSDFGAVVGVHARGHAVVTRRRKKKDGQERARTAMRSSSLRVERRLVTVFGRISSRTHTLQVPVSERTWGSTSPSPTTSDLRGVGLAPVPMTGLESLVVTPWRRYVGQTKARVGQRWSRCGAPSSRRTLRICQLNPRAKTSGSGSQAPDSSSASRS